MVWGEPFVKFLSNKQQSTEIYSGAPRPGFAPSQQWAPSVFVSHVNQGPPPLTRCECSVRWWTSGAYCTIKPCLNGRSDKTQCARNTHHYKEEKKPFLPPLLSTRCLVILLGEWSHLVIFTFRMWESSVGVGVVTDFSLWHIITREWWY